MGQAITDHASDLHIEPCSTHIAIRMRIDGVLHDSSTVPLELLRPLVSRVKILAGLDIAQNRLAQDGRFSLTIDGRSVDVRVVTMPTAAGEAVILRLLDPVRDALGISSLGLSPAERARFIPAFTASQGAVFIVGPDRFGEDVDDLRGAVARSTRATKSIVSVEDPVEFRLDGIKQMQINPRAGLTFPTALPIGAALPTPTSCSSVRSATPRPRASRPTRPSPVTSCCRRCTRRVPRRRRCDSSRWASSRTSSRRRSRSSLSQRLARRLCELCAEPADDATIDLLRGLGADDAHPRRCDGAPRGRLPGVPEHRLRGPAADLRDHARHRRHQPPDPRTGIPRRRSRTSRSKRAWRHSDAALRRVADGELSVEEMLRVHVLTVPHLERRAALTAWLRRGGRARRILPEADFGIASTNVSFRTCL